MKCSHILKNTLAACFVTLCLMHSSFAEERQYPPYPDVWERVFIDNIDSEWIGFIPANNGDVIVRQSDRVDGNGNDIRDKKVNTVDLKDLILFFENRIVKNYRKDSRINKAGISHKLKKQTHSSGGSDFVSKDIPLKDGGKIRWIKGLVTDETGQYRRQGDYKQKTIDGVLQYQYESDWTIDDTSHTTYYNHPTVLEKTDKDGKVLWQKAYLYFHPWWMTRYWKGEDTYVHNFMYFKRGTLALLDEDRMFLYFGGARKIFRLTQDGNAVTEDKNLMVMNYRDYKDLVEEMIKKIDKYENSRVRKNSGPSFFIGNSSKYPLHKLGDYDYFGEQLCKKQALDIKSPNVIKVIKEHREFSKVIDVYYREMEMKGVK